VGGRDTQVGLLDGIDDVGPEEGVFEGILVGARVGLERDGVALGIRSAQLGP